MKPKWSPRRIQCFEFGDQPWLRGWFREAYVDGMNFAMRFGSRYRNVCVPFAEWVRRAVKGAAPHANAERSEAPTDVLDVGSGGGGSIDTLISTALQRGEQLPKIVLSDAHPNVAHYRELVRRHGPERVGYLPTPTPAVDPAARAFRLRSFCTVFHHFNRATARRVLEEATCHGDGVFIVEPFRRDWWHFFVVLLGGPLLYLPAPFFSKRITLRKVLVGTLIPIVPFMLLFDGCVSVLRVYSSTELEGLFPESQRHRFAFASGAIRYAGVFHTTYFFAYRKADASRGRHEDQEEMRSQQS